MMGCREEAPEDLKGSHFKPSQCLPVNGRARSVVLLVSLRLRAGGRLAGFAPSSL